MDEIASFVQSLFTTIADETAKDAHLIQRQRKLTGATFAQTLILGWLHQPHATLPQLSQMAATLGVTITPQGLAKRFTPTTAAWLKQVLEVAVTHVIAADPVAIPLLQRFTAVAVQDSTVIILPEALQQVWRGCGGGKSYVSPAGIKLQVRLDLATGVLQGPLLQDGRVHDLLAPAQTRSLPAGALRIADLGYFTLAHLRALGEHQVYWLTRWQAGTTMYDERGLPLDLAVWLGQQATSHIDCQVYLGSQRLPARLIAVQVPPEIAARRARNLKEEAQRRGQKVSQRRLYTTHWTLYLTNVPPSLLTIPEVLVLGRARWQIELLFKLWKQDAAIDESVSANPWRMLCELYAKLIGMVLQHWILLTSCWQYPNRSLVKAAQTVRSYAVVLANALAGLTTLARVLQQIQRCLATGCRMNSRKKRPNAYQLLLAPA